MRYTYRLLLKLQLCHGSLQGHGRCLRDIHDYAQEPEYEQREMVVSYQNQKGERRVHGGKHLKESQSYPRGFGVALAKVRSKHAKRNFNSAVKFLKAARKTANDFDRRPRINRAWMAGANLQPVFDFLTSS